MEKLRTCFFTGHRHLPSGKIEIIRNKIYENIERLITEYDVRYFISGGAIGFDTEAAMIVAEIKKKYPHIRLLMYLPCYGQSKKWDDKNKYIYNLVLANSDEILYVSEEPYKDGCMQKRNIRMIKDSFFCIAFCIRSGSGTGFTLRNGERAGIKIFNIADEIYN